jgi:Carboxypeptidase regulatory-like domain/TonB-dependent Receptor Plug Domain/TonB dependent receptor
MDKNISRGVTLYIALMACFAALVPLQLAQAASGDGSLVGRIVSDGSSVDGAEVTVRNPETGFSRTVKTDADGSYRFPFLPVGRYTVEAVKGGKPLGKLTDVSVNLGTATTADITLNAPSLDTIEVVGTRVVNAVDVSSVESATNITREELELLPVDRNLSSVAMLAPGLTKGDSDLGEGGISFGGSSVAENTVYINGLNVTDFYNRVGASTVPYAFYKEFQVKTGGYSVEFGRTTGGVINAVTRSGTNNFDYGTEIVWEPEFLQARGGNHFDSEGNSAIISRFDDYDRRNINVFASGPIIHDKLFFFAMYEARDYQKRNTSDSGNVFFDGEADNGFWGAKVDWQISDKHLLEALAFSDKNQTVRDNFAFDFETGQRGNQTNRDFLDEGGRNWALTYTGYLAEAFSMKVLYGQNKRDFARNSVNDVACNRIRDLREIGDGDVGCTSALNVTARTDDREAARLDFQWKLDKHQLRFGLDRENNTSDHDLHYPGPEDLLYEIRDTTPGATLENGGTVPAGVTAYVRAREQTVKGEFETLNTAYYLEDNWSVTPRLVLNAGVRLEAFDNKNSAGGSYIKITDMVAPRFGFSWDRKGDNRSKIFGNLGRYFLPVANVINIKQAGALLDERTYFAFQGLEPFEYNGQTFLRPKLGPQIGAVDNSQGDGTVGDLRGEVDDDMDPVYQDELILGFQSMIDDKWSWGLRGIYRRLHNAIDDMEITSNGILCSGEPTPVGFVMGNPGKPLTVYTDTNCDGANDAFVTIDTANAGWALFDDDGNFIGERGYVEPKRTYKAFEFAIDRAWDRQWTFNGSYTLAFNKGNIEGPVNSDTDFADAGRTEAFDDPWVNLNGYGYLPNDRRHQFKLRGAYTFLENWQIGATLNAQSGRPINAFGVGNPFDGTNYHSFYICVSNCTSDNPSERVYELRERGSAGRLPWTYDLGANVSYRREVGPADMKVRFAVYNLLNSQRLLQVDDELETDIGFINPQYRLGNAYQSPRFAQLTVSLEF